MNEDVTIQTVTVSVVQTAMAAKEVIDQNEYIECAEIANDFLVVMSEAGLVTIDEAMSDLEKIERGMYAANLYLAACAKIGKTETERLKNAESLERALQNS